MKSDVDFLKSGITPELMKLKHERKMYPPRIKITVRSSTTGTSPVAKLTATFEGSSSNEDLNQDILLPLGTVRIASSRKVVLVLNFAINSVVVKDTSNSNNGTESREVLTSKHTETLDGR